MAKPVTVTEPGPLQGFLFAAFPDVKRIKVKQWLKYGSVLVNGTKRTRHDHPLVPGDEVRVRSEDETRAASLLPQTIKIIHEDDALIVIAKPPGLLSIASVGEKNKTAYSYLTHYVRRGDARDPSRVWVVHRLDQETSGLMVFGKTEAAKSTLQQSWDAAEKRYLAVVEGLPVSDEGVLDSFLDESNPHHVKSVPESADARLATTRYRVVKRAGDLTLLELTLITGRRHQIRVQLRDIGCPIIGDRKYDARTDPAGRLGLHACFLRLPHPVTSVPLELRSPLPPSLSRVVRGRLA